MGCQIRAGGHSTVLAEQAGGSRTVQCRQNMKQNACLTPKSKEAGTGRPAEHSGAQFPLTARLQRAKGARWGATVGVSAPDTGLHAAHALSVSRPGP